MGNSTSRVIGCLVPSGGKRDGVELHSLDPLDEGLGHSFCYVRPAIFYSPTITPSNSGRFTMYSSTLDSETLSGSFRREVADGSSCFQKPHRHLSETTFKTISGASVSANVSTARTGNMDILSMADTQEPAASFESTALFAAIPLQPVPHGSGLANGFMSGPLERGFASGPLERGGGFMSGPLEKNMFMSGPMEGNDRSNFSAPLSYGRKNPGIGRLVRSLSRPVRHVFSWSHMRHYSGFNRMQRWFLNQSIWHHHREDKFRIDGCRSCLEVGPLGSNDTSSHSLQWAQGKAGEDRVHVVVSEEQGWLFVGIYDGFSGPDAPDFLASNLYEAIDKELEGLLWECDESAERKFDGSNHICESDNARDSKYCVVGQQVKSCETPNVSKMGCIQGENDVCGEIHKKINAVNDTFSHFSEIEDKVGKEIQKTCSAIKQSCKVGTTMRNMEIDEGENTIASSTVTISKENRKNVRLFELLQMELMLEFASTGSSKTEIEEPSEELQSSMGGKCDSGDKSKHKRSANEDNNYGSLCEPLAPIQNRRQMMKDLMMGTKRKKMYRKHKSLHKKMLPWSYNWRRDQNIAVERELYNDADCSSTIRRCKVGTDDHAAVLNAMSRALEKMEVAYMDMVERALGRNPELALMGSCVLVMLLKDEDVYIMNVGDSRLILAQERINDRAGPPNISKDDTGLGNKSRELIERLDLDKTSEESSMHTWNNRFCKFNKKQEISYYKLRTRAIQLTTDHSTGVEEEVIRIQSEHADDSQAVSKNRVKGQLKVTRAFGAAFLKKPHFNQALLEMFQIDYIGNSPYVCCTPSVHHHHLSSKDRFLILSSDGLYQYFSNEEAVSHVAWFIENVPEGDPAQYLVTELLLRAAKENGMEFHELLGIPHGDRRKYHDDVSVMVISLEGRIWRSHG